MMTEETATCQAQIKEVLWHVRGMLREKNKAYGDSALAPLDLVKGVSRLDKLWVRIEDKLKRWRNRGARNESEDVLLDLIGYLELAMIVEALDSDLPEGCTDWRVDIRGEESSDGRFGLLREELEDEMYCWRPPALRVFCRQTWTGEQQDAVLDWLFVNRSEVGTSRLLLEVAHRYVMLYSDRVAAWEEAYAEEMA